VGPANDPQLQGPLTLLLASRQLVKAVENESDQPRKVFSFPFIPRFLPPPSSLLPILCKPKQTHHQTNPNHKEIMSQYPPQG
jgi:hypothetical protein